MDRILCHADAARFIPLVTVEQLLRHRVTSISNCGSEGALITGSLACKAEMLDITDRRWHLDLGGEPEVEFGRLQHVDARGSHVVFSHFGFIPSTTPWHSLVGNT